MISRRHLLAAALAASPAAAQTRKPVAPSGAALSAASEVMAGAPLGVSVTRAPPGARLAIARPQDASGSAVVVAALPATGEATLPSPGLEGSYEIRLATGPEAEPVIIARRPFLTRPPHATVSAPARVARGNGLPVRGIGPNGEADRVVLVPEGSPAGEEGPSFFPAENVEATLDAPDRAGAYELRYVMNAPLAENRILATRKVIVD